MYNIEDLRRAFLQSRFKFQWAKELKFRNFSEYFKSRDFKKAKDIPNTKTYTVQDLRDLFYMSRELFKLSPDFKYRDFEDVYRKLFKVDVE